MGGGLLNFPVGYLLDGLFSYLVSLFHQFDQFMRVESLVSDLISLISQYVNGNKFLGGDMGPLSDFISPFSPILAEGGAEA